MFKIFAPLCFFALASFSPAQAHLALDHLKEGLASRFDQVARSHQLSQEDKARALSQLRSMQTKYTSLLSLSHIPSQKQAAEQEIKLLNQEIQEFDKTLNTLTSNSSKS